MFDKEIEFTKSELKEIFERIMSCDGKYPKGVWKDVISPMAETIESLQEQYEADDEDREDETYLTMFADENEGAKAYILMYFKTKDPDFVAMAKDELRHAVKFYGLANAEANTPAERAEVEQELGRHTEIKSMLPLGVV